MAIAVAFAAPVQAGGWGVHSERVEARIGGAFYDTGPLTAFGFSGGVINGEILAPSPGFLGVVGSPRPYLGIDAAIADDPIHFFYGGLVWDYHLTDRFHLSAGAGGALHTARELVRSPTTRSLGTRATFHLGFAAGYDVTPDLAAQVYWNHFSNAYLARPNEGHDSMGIRIGFRF